MNKAIFKEANINFSIASLYISLSTVKKKCGFSKSIQSDDSIRPVNCRPDNAISCHSSNNSSIVIPVFLIILIVFSMYLFGFHCHEVFESPTDNTACGFMYQPECTPVVKNVVLFVPINFFHTFFSPFTKSEVHTPEINTQQNRAPPIQ